MNEIRLYAVIALIVAVSLTAYHFLPALDARQEQNKEAKKEEAKKPAPAPTTTPTPNYLPEAIALASVKVVNQPDYTNDIHAIRNYLGWILSALIVGLVAMVAWGTGLIDTIRRLKIEKEEDKTEEKKKKGETLEYAETYAKLKADILKDIDQTTSPTPIR